MRTPDRSNLIIDEANGIIENYIRKKTGIKHGNKKIVLLSILTISAAIILVFVIKII